MASVPPSHEAIGERNAYRAALKKEYMRQILDPHRHGSGEGGVVFDPAIQRFAAMRACPYDHFKATPRTSMIGFLILIPFISYGWLLKRDKEAFEKKCRTGQLAYADREFKFI